MYSKDDYKILQLRNQTSLCLDDLVALVTNSSVANQLRDFSSDVMELTPGFIFGLKQAKLLHALTTQRYKQYKAGNLTDVDLMNYQIEANAILKGDIVQIGGKQVGIFDKLLHGKEIKRKEAIESLERNLQDVAAKIEACQEKMKQCVADSKGHSPSSMAYRNNERTWQSEKNRLTMLNKQAADLLRALEEIDRIRAVEEYGALIKNMNVHISTIIGNGKELAGLEAEVEMQSEKNSILIGQNENIGEGIFKSALEETTVSSNSEFAAQVVAEERRQNMLDFASITQADAPAAQTVAANDSFAAQVASKNED